jgi:hypothetical protein
MAFDYAFGGYMEWTREGTLLEYYVPLYADDGYVTDEGASWSPEAELLPIWE